MCKRCAKRVESRCSAMVGILKLELDDREQLSARGSVSFLKTDLLVRRAWFMDHPSNWRPNNKNILYESFHVNWVEMEHLTYDSRNILQTITCTPLQLVAEK